VLEPATPPAQPYSPHPRRIMLFGLLAALGIGIVGIVAAEKLDNTFETGVQLEALTTLPILSTVPTIPHKYKRKAQIAGKVLTINGAPTIPLEHQQAFQKQRLIMLSDPESVGAQQYGILALKVWRWLGDSEGRTLLVTSAAGEEGKSLTALNLALALASTLHGRVLLVDADMHLPQVRQRLGLSAGKGLSELLEGNDTDLEPYISRINNLDVICAGSTPRNPAALLASSRTREVLGKLREHYQVIVLDSPPVVPIPDSHILAGICDGVLLVARARHTRQDLLQRAADSLGGANLTVVLNDVDYTATPYAHAYQY
jgi:capsular exopolysaccharide synthesis family protein